MNSKENESGIIGHFSVALGLFDYIISTEQIENFFEPEN